MAEGVFSVVLGICGIVIFFSFVKVVQALKMRSEIRSAIFDLDEEQIKAVKAISYSELRSESSLNKLQNAIKPKVLAKLRSPASAVLCSPLKMSIEEKDGKFVVKGYVDSQNGFGAMQRANFRAKCVYDPKCKFWMVENIFLYE